MGDSITVSTNGSNVLDDYSSSSSSVNENSVQRVTTGTSSNSVYEGLAPISGQASGPITVIYKGDDVVEEKGFFEGLLSDAADFWGDVACDIGSGIKTACSDVANWWENDAWPALEKVGETVANVFERVGATLATAITSLVEGLAQFTGALIDGLAVLGNVLLTPIYALVDLGQMASVSLFGGEYNSFTESMWADCRAFVSTEFVTPAFDSFYENTAVGNWMKEEAYGFDTVRMLGNGVGYVSGVIILSLLTMGLSDGVTALSGIGSLGTAVASTGSVQAIIGGIAGLGKGTDKAWQDEDTTILEGLGYGVGTGAWEAFQFWIGSKIAGSKFFLPAGEGAQLTLGNKVLNSLCKVILDGADGGAEGFIQPLLDLIYKDGYYDEEGVYHEFESEDLYERYCALFEANGGWKTVGTNAAIGSIASAIGESIDVGGFIKHVKDGKAYYVFSSLEDIANISDFRNFDADNSFFIVDGQTYNYAKIQEMLQSKNILSMDTIIEFSDGIGETKKIKLQTMVDFLNNEVDDYGGLIKDCTDIDSYFTVNGVTPNEMGHAIKAYIDKYGADAFYKKCNLSPKKVKWYLMRYYSQTDPFSLSIENIVNGELAEEMLRNYGDYILPGASEAEKLAYIKGKLNDSIKFLDDDIYDFVHGPGDSAGFNNDIGTFIKMRLPESLLKEFEGYSKATGIPVETLVKMHYLDTIFHESNHQMTRRIDIGLAGLMLLNADRKYEGINEALTDYLAMLRDGSLYKLCNGGSLGASGYAKMVYMLKSLESMGLLDRDTMCRAYFSNDITVLVSRLKQGNEFYREMTIDEIEELFDIFDKSIPNNVNDLVAADSRWRALIDKLSTGVSREGDTEDLTEIIEEIVQSRGN